MEARTDRSSAPPDLDTMEGFAAYISEARATGDQAVIDEAFATLARRGGKGWADLEPDMPDDGPEPAHQCQSPHREQNEPQQTREATEKRANPIGNAIRSMFRRTEHAPAAKTEAAQPDAVAPASASHSHLSFSRVIQTSGDHAPAPESARSPENLLEPAQPPENSPVAQETIGWDTPQDIPQDIAQDIPKDVPREIPPQISTPPKVSLSVEPGMSAKLSSRRPRRTAQGGNPRRKARRYILPAIVVAGVLAALLVGSPLNVPVLPTEGVWHAAPTPYAAGREPAFAPLQQPPQQPLGQMQAASPAKTAAATQPGASLSPNDGNHRQNEGLVAQRDKLQAELRALAAQIAGQNTRFNELRARTGEAAQKLAAMPEISAHIARDTGTLSELQAELEQARQKLASLRAQEVKQHAAPAQTNVARTSPGQTNVARTNFATSAPPPETRYDPVRSLERQWRREGAQLIAARGALSTGDSTQARQWIEAVQTELVFQPVSPGNPLPGPGGSNIPARLLGQAIALLNAGATSSAMVVLDRAIAYLGATPIPTTEATSTSPD